MTLPTYASQRNLPVPGKDYNLSVSAVQLWRQSKGDYYKRYLAQNKVTDKIMQTPAMAFGGLVDRHWKRTLAKSCTGLRTDNSIWSDTAGMDDPDGLRNLDPNIEDYALEIANTVYLKRPELWSKVTSIASADTAIAEIKVSKLIGNVKWAGRPDLLSVAGGLDWKMGQWYNQQGGRKRAMDASQGHIKPGAIGYVGRSLNKGQPQWVEQGALYCALAGLDIPSHEVHYIWPGGIEVYSYGKSEMARALAALVEDGNTIMEACADGFTKYLTIEQQQDIEAAGGRLGSFL